MDPALLAACQDRHAAHERGADHRCASPDQRRVEPDAGQRYRRFPAPADQPVRQRQENPGHNRQVEAGDGDNVAGPGGGKRFGNRGRDAAFHAQQDARQERGLGLRQHRQDHRQGPRFETVERFP